MTHPTGARVYDRIQIAKWRDELAAQEADPEAMGPAPIYDAEAIDIAAEAEYWREHPQTPRRPLTWGDVRGLLFVLIVASSPWWGLWLFNEWQALGGWMH